MKLSIRIFSITNLYIHVVNVKEKAYLFIPSTVITSYLPLIDDD